MAEKTRDLATCKPTVNDSCDVIANKIPFVNTHEELNELAKAILEKKEKQTITIDQEIIQKVQQRLDVLRTGKIEADLQNLESRITDIKKLLALAPTAPNNPTYKPSFFSNITQNVSNAFTGAFDLVGKMPIPRFAQRLFYTSLTFPQFLPGGQYLGQSMIDAGKKNLALMDIQDFIGQHKGEGFAFDLKCTDIEWARVVKSGKDVSELVSEYITVARTADDTKKADLKQVTIAKLLSVESIRKDIESSAEAALKQAMLAQDAWKIEGKAPDSITFGTETSWKDGNLIVKRTDVTTEGTPVAGSDAEKLMKSKRLLPSVHQLSIGTGSEFFLSWNGDKKLIKMPNTSDIPNLENINTIMQKSKPKYLSEIKISSNDDQNEHLLVRTTANGIGTLTIRNNSEVIAQLANYDLSNFKKDDESGSNTWLYRNGNIKIGRAHV